MAARDADDPRRRGRAGDPRAPARSIWSTRATTCTRRADAETAQRDAEATRCPTSCCSTGCCPGKSGLALAKQLRGDARTRELPIIMVTARTDEADKVAGLEAWVDDYVTKPFSPRELKARIKAVLRRRAPEAAQEPLAAGALQARPDDASRDRRRRAGRSSARPNSGCCASCSRARSACTRARSCSTRSGAITCTSRSARSTCTSGACASRSSRSARTGSIETVRGSGYRLAAPR